MKNKVKLRKGGWVTIPAEIVRKLDLKTGTKVKMTVEDGAIVLEFCKEVEE